MDNSGISTRDSTSQFTRFENNRIRLAETIDLLEGKLAPILKPSYPIDSAVGPAPAEPSSFEAINGLYELQLDKLAYITGRIDL